MQIKINGRYILGIALLVMGILAIISNLQILGDRSVRIGWAVIFGVASGFALYYSVKRPAQRWLLPLGLALLGLAVSRVLAYFPATDDFANLTAVAWVGLALLLAVFYGLNNWLLVIPAGIFLSLAAVEAFRAWQLDLPTEGVLFLGTGLAFLLLFFLPARIGKTNWALIPAAVLLAIGALASYQDVTQATGYLLPALLLLAGGGVLVYTFRR